MKHPCMGRYSAHRLAACADCRLRGPCATKTSDPDGFGVLHHPRYLPPVAMAHSTRVVTAWDAVIVKQFTEILKGVGLHRPGMYDDAWWRVKSDRGKAVAYLSEARPNRVSVTFSDARPSRLADMPSAALVDIFPPPKQLHVWVPLSSTAIAADPVDAARLVTEVASRLYTNER